MSTPAVVERIEVHPDNLFYQEHLARYHFAYAHLSAGVVLDIACGAGYGADLLSDYNKVKIVAIDIDRASLLVARKGYHKQNICFLAADGVWLPIRDHSVQAIVTLETIEHIEHDRTFVAELSRTLRSDGVCILSTPNVEHSERWRRLNPYHVREYREDELRHILGEYFEDVSIYYQGWSDRYHERITEYTKLIVDKKLELNPIIRCIVKSIYAPVRHLLSDTAKNMGIRKLLKLTYPQPEPCEITISREPLMDTNVFVAMCRRPRRFERGGTDRLLV